MTTRATGARGLQITAFPDYKDALVDSFTNGAGKVPTNVATVPKEIKSATSIVTAQLTVNRKPNEIYKGQRDKIRQFVLRSNCQMHSDSHS